MFVFNRLTILCSDGLILGGLDGRGIDSFGELLIDNLCLFYVFLGIFGVLHLADAGDDIVLLREIDQAHALGSTTHDSHIGYLQTDEDTRLVDDHQVVLVGNNLDGYQAACLLGDGEGLDTLGATGGLTIVFDF